MPEESAAWFRELEKTIGGIPRDVNNDGVRDAVNTILKARIVSDHQLFIKLWCTEYEQVTGNKYLFMVKDANAVKLLLKQIPDVQHLMRIARAAWPHRDRWPCNASLSLPKFLGSINEIRDALNGMHYGNRSKGQMPEFKQLELLEKMRKEHVCCPGGLLEDPSACTPAKEKEYDELRAKIKALKANQNRQALNGQGEARG